MKAVLLLFISASAMAWGPIGHYVIGDIAEKHLTSKSKKMIKRILKGETLSRVGVWADFVRSDSKYDSLASFHYVNIPKGKRYSDVRPSPRGDLLSGIKFCAEQLQKDKVNNQGEILKLLVHLMGDMHQPLHNGYQKDRGGNDEKVTWFGKKTNLHMVWDEHIIELQKLSFSEYAAILNIVSKNELINIHRGTILSWHQEGRDYINKIYQRSSSRHWEYQYSYAHLSVLEARLVRAGIRLAHILNKIFDKSADELLDKSIKTIVPKVFSDHP